MDGMEMMGQIEAAEKEVKTGLANMKRMAYFVETASVRYPDAIKVDFTAYRKALAEEMQEVVADVAETLLEGAYKGVE